MHAHNEMQFLNYSVQSVGFASILITFAANNPFGFILLFLHDLEHFPLIPAWSV